MPLIMQYFIVFKAFKALSYWVFVLFYLFFPACPKNPTGLGFFYKPGFFWTLMRRNYCCYVVSHKITCHWTSVHIFAKYWPYFRNGFTDTLWTHAISWLLNILPHLNYVATPWLTKCRYYEYLYDYFQLCLLAPPLWQLHRKILKARLGITKG